MSSAYEELAAGAPGAAFVQLLYAQVALTARAHNFPPPEGHDRWDAAAVDGVAHDFFADRRGPARLAAITAAAVDDDSLRRVLGAAVLNFHRDRSRATDFGALVLRVGEVLAASALFEPVGDDADGRRWRLRDGSAAVSTAGAGVLAAAAGTVSDIVVPKWTSSRRRAPVADFASLERILTAVFAVANGSLRAVDGAAAAAARLDVTRVPLAVELDVLEQRPSDPTGDGRPETVLSRVRAKELFDGTSDREKVLLAHFDTPVRDLQGLVGIGRSQASDSKRRLVAALREALVDDDDPDEVVHALMDLARAWLAERTSWPGATFNSNDGP